MGWVWLVVFGGRNSSSTFGWAGQLSIIIAILRFSRLIRLSRSLAHFSKRTELIQVFLLAWYSTGTVMFLNERGFGLLPMTNKGYLSVALIVAPTNTVMCDLGCLTPWCGCPVNPSELCGNRSQKRPVSSALYSRYRFVGLLSILERFQYRRHHTHLLLLCD